MRYLTDLLMHAEEDSGSNFPCLWAIMLLSLIVGLYASWFIYRHFIGRWLPKTRYCRFCGQMVEPISDCCHGPVDADRLPPLCQACKMNCELVCSLCKRPF